MVPRYQRKQDRSFFSNRQASKRKVPFTFIAPKLRPVTYFKQGDTVSCTVEEFKHYSKFGLILSTSVYWYISYKWDPSCTGMEDGNDACYRRSGAIFPTGHEVITDWSNFSREKFIFVVTQSPVTTTWEI